MKNKLLRILLEHIVIMLAGDWQNHSEQTRTKLMGLFQAWKDCGLND